MGNWKTPPPRAREAQGRPITQVCGKYVDRTVDSAHMNRYDNTLPRQGTDETGGFMIYNPCSDDAKHSKLSHSDAANKCMHVYDPSGPPQKSASHALFRMTATKATDDQVRHVCSTFMHAPDAGMEVHYQQAARLSSDPDGGTFCVAPKPKDPVQEKTEEKMQQTTSMMQEMATMMRDMKELVASRSSQGQGQCQGQGSRALRGDEPPMHHDAPTTMMQDWQKGQGQGPPRSDEPLMHHDASDGTSMMKRKIL